VVVRMRAAFSLAAKPASMLSILSIG